jgi:hypothetical protein
LKREERILVDWVAQVVQYLKSIDFIGNAALTRKLEAGDAFSGLFVFDPGES